MADTEMVDVNVGGQSAQSQSNTKPEPGFTYRPLQFLMVLFAIGGLVLVIVAGTTEFPVVYDENQWIKLRVMRSTSDGLLMTLENETAPAGMGKGGVLNLPWESRSKIAVPYDCLSASLGCALLSLSAMCFFANSTLQRDQGSAKMKELSEIIQQGAKNFMLEEAKYIVVFAAVMTIVIGLVKNDYKIAINYIIGACLSYSAGYIGMAMATRTNCRTASACWKSEEANGNGSLAQGLQVAFRGGAVMGQAVVGLGLFGVAFCYFIWGDVKALAGYGAGASTIALFARVAGGIYTKAADVGADLVGKVTENIPEDDSRNPATIADNVGDNVGDIAGMGADLFESFVGGIIAAMVLGSQRFGAVGASLPLWVACVGIIGGILGDSYISTSEDATLKSLLHSMHVNIYVSSVLILGGIAGVCWVVLADVTESSYTLADGKYTIQTPTGVDAWSVALRIFLAVVVGLLAGEFISQATEYFTSHDFSPTRNIAKAGRFAAGTVIIQGIGQGMLSTVIPTILVTITIIWAYTMLSGFAVAMAAVGMLSTLGVTMACDAYGPIADNAGGIAEMADDIGTDSETTREKTDLLDAMGNTTAATGKGFSNASAVLTALSTLAAFMDEAGLVQVSLTGNIFVIAGLMIGALLPYIFVAQTMLAVGRAAEDMIAEVQDQFSDPVRKKGIMDRADGYRAGQANGPDHNKCIMISTAASIREMILPGCMAVFAPLVIGFLFGALGLCGMLLGSISSGYLMGVMTSNAGGAWDNAKKYVEAGYLNVDENGVKTDKHNRHGKGTETHHNVVAGDTVGDPFKDTSGPALNCLIKLMTLFAFVFATAFPRSVTAANYGEKWYIGLILIVVFGMVVMMVSYGFPARPDLMDKIEKQRMQNEAKAAQSMPLKDESSPVEV